jgi:hypothetical protein
MEEYIEFIKKKGYDKKIIELVKSSILIAEQYISMPSSGKIVPELMKEIDRIHSDTNDN